jgi:hypothetical protein
MAFDPLSALLDLGGKLIDKLLPDPAAKAAAIQKLAELKQSGDLAILAAETDLMKGQMDINKVEAANTNLFVAGWRPGVGWVCVAALAMQFIVGPLLLWGSHLVGHPITVPEMNLSALMPIVLGMLGLGTLRTVEKLAGAQNDQGNAPGPSVKLK